LITTQPPLLLILTLSLGAGVFAISGIVPHLNVVFLAIEENAFQTRIAARHCQIHEPLYLRRPIIEWIDHA
jgi:hypothetical protein